MNAGAVGTAIVSIVMAIIGVAIIALILSPSAQTGSVLTAGGSAFSSVLSTALSPVTNSSGIGGITI
jgi:PRD1 phage membrane DNA delivery